MFQTVRKPQQDLVLTGEQWMRPKLHETPKTQEELIWKARRYGTLHQLYLNKWTECRQNAESKPLHPGDWNLDSLPDRHLPSHYSLQPAKPRALAQKALRKHSLRQPLALLFLCWDTYVKPLYFSELRGESTEQRHFLSTVLNLRAYHIVMDVINNAFLLILKTMVLVLNQMIQL